MRDYLRRDRKIRFAFPIDGDCLNIYDGVEKDGALWVKVKVEADKDSKIEINQIPATWNGECFEVEMPFNAYRTNLVAKDKDGNEEKIVVYKLINPTGIYRLSSDDNILFLQDINDHKDTYTSIFDNPYLAMYKKAHDDFGATVQLNIHWEYEADNQYFSDPSRKDFNLSMMTDKFKEEWIANSDWLRLSFHAREPQTCKPYEHTDMKTITADAEKIYREVIRFAGEETLCVHNTTIHWGECTLDGVRAMSNLGTRGLYGYFYLRDGKPFVSYFYPEYLIEHIDTRDFWMDTEEDILCGKIDLVLNSYPLEEIIPKLEEVKAKKGNYGCVEIMIHEQYFHEDYVNYIPEFRQIVWDACKWCADNGYKGYFMQDVMEKN